MTDIASRSSQEPDGHSAHHAAEKVDLQLQPALNNPQHPLVPVNQSIGGLVSAHVDHQTDAGVLTACRDPVRQMMTEGSRVITDRVSAVCFCFVFSDG